MDNSANQSLYDLLVTRDFEPEILDSSGKAITNPADAEMFSFDWKTENKNYGTVVILIGAENNIQVYFGDNLGRTMEADDRTEWYDFLQQLKQFASRNLMTFEINNISRLKYTMQGMAAINEGLFEGYYGKKNVSYSDQPQQTKLVIKHNRDLAEGEARYRAIESIYVETANGERFRVPSRSLAHGKMIARHVAEGGNPYDAFGQHINQVVAEMHTMARFIRATRNKNFDDDTGSLVETAIRHYGELKAKAKRMISHRGYNEEREKFDPAEFSDSEVTAEAIRDMFVEQSVDHRIEDALPILARLASSNKEEKMREADEFEGWANKVMEGTWALPETPEAQKQLQELMSKPLIVGADATNATEQLYDLVGDDELFDRLSDLAERDANANCWDDEAVINRLGELGVDISATAGPEDTQSDDTEQDDTEQDEPVLPEGILDTAKKIGSRVFDKLGGGSDQELLDKLRKDAGLPPRMAKPNDEVEEDLDTDGVMMTKASNMSS
jgi:hypothetical protein